MSSKRRERNKRRSDQSERDRLVHSHSGRLVHSHSGVVTAHQPNACGPQRPQLKTLQVRGGTHVLHVIFTPLFPSSVSLVSVVRLCTIAVASTLLIPSDLTKIRGFYTWELLEQSRTRRENSFPCLQSSNWSIFLAGNLLVEKSLVSLNRNFCLGRAFC